MGFLIFFRWVYIYITLLFVIARRFENADMFFFVEHSIGYGA